jgi:mRNA interferase MazF
MARTLRGEIRWADLNPVPRHEQAGARPVLILSHDVFNDRSGTVMAVALTSQEPKAGYPLALELTTPRLPKRSWVKTSQIRTLPTERIGKRLGRASVRELASVLEGCSRLSGSFRPRSLSSPNACAERRAMRCWSSPAPRGVALTEKLDPMVDIRGRQGS